MKLINIGFGNYVSDERIVCVASPEAAPIKRLVQEARDRGTLIDASCGRKTKSVIVTDSDHVVLSAMTNDTIAARACGKKTEDDEDD
jgi:hypothetical protein